ncbi:Protein of unknown function [Cognatiyoonia koreensis]|uniref:DUF3072 domain-containing protein n=1 Tax=Cognatiyoonia koreensis TaxID=364200 RepID=A0A1I0N7Q3_9RHOB|nr:DUF3072 domain-containing protein [Cognatiyoonia koreensis]SEV96704.1 Protein of unknown function [Cognatiyoonia koreensis]
MISPKTKAIAPETARLDEGSAVEPMTSLQADKLRALCEASDEQFRENLTQAEADAEIERLSD